MRNDLSIHDRVADQWWSDEVRWVCTLKNLLPGRLKRFNRNINWPDKAILNLGCTGGFMAEAMAARHHARGGGQPITHDAGMGAAQPYAAEGCDAVVCVDVLEHVADLDKVSSKVARALRPGGLLLFDAINRNPLSRFATITVAENMLGLLPRGTRVPRLFIKRHELRKRLTRAGIVAGPTQGLGPRGIDRRGDTVFGPVPHQTVIYLGVARKPEGAE